MNKIDGVLKGLIVLVSLQACAVTGTNRIHSEYNVPDPPGEIVTIDQEIIIFPFHREEFISNPGIGWQYRPETSITNKLPETVLYPDRRAIAWKALNPKEEIYDWSSLDFQLREAVEQGKQLSFRVYTMVGEGYDGHMVPEWVVRKGAVILKSGAPDYSNCIYQEEWGNFINQLVRRYDGNPDIAFIDISGYGNFSEWSWQDEQTEWDPAWQENYRLGSVTPDHFKTLDGQARRRLADIFIGGENSSHHCREADGTISLNQYSYPGFESTQLVMPYAGIVQSTQYVYSREPDVGFRYDCLGREGEHILEKVGREMMKVWKSAPVVFEFCVPSQVSLKDAEQLIRTAHASIVHDNEWGYSSKQLEEILKYAGYRYFLQEARIKSNSSVLQVQMTWQNLGYAPNYPKMGQNFTLYFYLLDMGGNTVLSLPGNADISTWMPADAPDEEAPSYEVSLEYQLPMYISRDEYLLGVSIREERSGKPINLAFGGRDTNGINILTKVELNH